MKEILYSKNFVRQYTKLPEKIQKKFDKRIALFKKKSHHPLLRIHKLKGDMVPFESMNVTGDMRALFIRGDAVITFHEIGTHSELY